MGDNKVVVLTKAKPMQKEEFVGVFRNLGALEKHLRKKISPYVKKESIGNSYTVNDNGDITLYFAHNTEIIS